MDWLAIISFDFSSILPIGCMWRSSFYDRLLLITLVPFGICFLMWAARLVLQWRCDRRGAPKGVLYRIFVKRASTLFLSFTWLIFSVTTSIIFQVSAGTCNLVQFLSYASSILLRHITVL
jgi:hypothetical protein